MNLQVTKTLITDFSNFSENHWQIVNDGVMGGISRSHLQIQSDGHAVFLGRLVLDNNSGFASVKNIQPLNLDEYKTLVLTVKGDGKQYKFRFKTGDGSKLHDWSYESGFWTVSDQWQTLEISLSDFNATYRGRKLEEQPPAELSNIKEYGFMISNRQEGNFRLEIASISATH